MKGAPLIKQILAIVLIGISAVFPVRAQLVITEVMTSATGSGSSQFPDWWELTNFGTNNVDLTGYCWNDDSHNGFAGAVNTSEFTGVIIHTNESIIFTEQGGPIVTASDFTNWWGLGPNVKVIVCLAGDNGLGSGGDTVRIWSTNLAALVSSGFNTNGMDLSRASDFLVDRVDTEPTTKGFSQSCNTNTGKFSVNSAVGVNGAFQAKTAADVGSPGSAPTNAGPIVITNQPVNVLANVGTTATFEITAFGLPKPRFQWLMNGSPLPNDVRFKTVFTITNNYSQSTLTISNVQVTDAATFRVNVTNLYQNGLQKIVSSNATLTVSSDPLAPIFTQKPAPENLYAYLGSGQTVTLNAAAFGNPPPTFEWRHNNVKINGESDAQYSFVLSDNNQAGTYTVTATNSAGGTNASILLTITNKPTLRITEILPTEATNAAGSSLGHNDWWELSNLGSFPVNLQGFRFDDNSAFTGIIPFSQSITITNNLIIEPGESIVLVEDMTPDEFRTWWGTDNLPPNLKIINYHGSGISFSGTAGDALTVWNAAATDEGDYIDSVSIASQPDAISYCQDPYDLNRTHHFGINPDGVSVLGVNGAFAAAILHDVGSPGTIVNYPKITGITRTGGSAQFTWISQSGFVYTVQCKTNLTDAVWTTLANTNAVNNLCGYTDTTAGMQRFYRVLLNLP